MPSSSESNLCYEWFVEFPDITPKLCQYIKIAFLASLKNTVLQLMKLTNHELANSTGGKDTLIHLVNFKT